jgi:hypothetical protein
MFSPCVLETLPKTKYWRFYLDCSYYTKTHGLIVVPRGTLVDLGSIPSILESIISNDAPYAREYFALHDYLYSNKSNHLGISKAEADMILIIGMEELGAAGWQCMLVWGALANFGYTHWKKD